jgi:hypothetical protein
MFGDNNSKDVKTNFMITRKFVDSKNIRFISTFFGEDLYFLYDLRKY